MGSSPSPNSSGASLAVCRHRNPSWRRPASWAHRLHPRSRLVAASVVDHPAHLAADHQQSQRGREQEERAAVATGGRLLEVDRLALAGGQATGASQRQDHESSVADDCSLWRWGNEKQAGGPLLLVTGQLVSTTE